MELANGTVLGGRYKIVKFLGQGGFGCTYLAQHAFLDAKFAIKEFFPADFCLRGADGSVRVATEARSADFDKLRQKFVREARALEHFKNTKGIVSVADVFEENGTAYFVMDYIEGMSVEKMLQLEGPMEEGLAVRIIRETAQALAEMHKRSFLHLDIKPDNIMLDFDYHPVLIDFGLAKQYDAADGHNSSTLLGCTPAFAPLEQINADVRRFYPATDIYSLGATLYAMLTGQNPDKASDRINFPHALSDDLPAGTSPAVAAAIDAAMRIPIAERPQSVAEFLAILDGAGGGAQPPKPPVATKPMAKPQSAPKPQPKPTPQPQATTPQPKPSPFKKALPWTIASAVIILGAIVFTSPLQKPLPLVIASVVIILGAILFNQLSNKGVIEEASGVINGHKYVDLGLSVKWATFNVDAFSPTSYGSYFAWGETSTKREFMGKNSLTYNRSGFGNIGGNSQYDAATAKWGAPWRLPTKADMEELCNRCTWKWTGDGYQVTGPNGNSIFLPTAGYRHGSSLYNAGSCGYYWSSTPYESSESAYYLYFNSSSPEVDWNSRYNGRSVRPVTE